MKSVKSALPNRYKKPGKDILPKSELVCLSNTTVPLVVDDGKTIDFIRKTRILFYKKEEFIFKIMYKLIYEHMYKTDIKLFSK